MPKTAGGIVMLDTPPRARLEEMVGDPVGEDGLPRATVIHAASFYAVSGFLPLVGPLLIIGLRALARVAIEPWYVPWILRQGGRNEEPGWAEDTALLLVERQALVQDSAFARFHRRQALRWGGALLLLGTLTFGLGFVLGAVPYLVLTYRAWARTRRGEWVELPWVAPDRPLVTQGPESLPQDGPGSGALPDEPSSRR